MATAIYAAEIMILMTMLCLVLFLLCECALGLCASVFCIGSILYSCVAHIVEHVRLRSIGSFLFIGCIGWFAYFAMSLLWEVSPGIYSDLMAAECDDVVIPAAWIRCMALVLLLAWGYGAWRLLSGCSATLLRVAGTVALILAVLEAWRRLIGAMF